MSRKKHHKRNNQSTIASDQGNSRRAPAIQQRRSGKKSRNRPTNPISIPATILLLVYIFIPTFTPNLMTLDTNTSKFLSLAIINLLAFLYLFTNKEIRQHPGYLRAFFHTGTGLAYAGFLITSLLSFTQAINLTESVLQFAKLFSVFSAAWFITVMVIRDLRLIRIAAIVVTGILVFDSLSVFYYIREFILRNIGSIGDIKSVYSNKNILASALFAKIPFALWLFVYEKGWLRRLGWFAMFVGITATFFMAARAFYVGLIVVTIILTAYSAINYWREREKQHLYTYGGYLTALLLGFALFSITQANLYPRSSGRHTAAIADQIASISVDDGSTRIRLNAWQWSLSMIKERPLMGVGAGNWKVNVLELENQTKPNFIYTYKAHNDFLEMPAEQGILGGLLYIGIYVLTALAFLKAYFHRRRTQVLYKYLFLATSGLVFFFFDAAFNFPHDRPEMMVLFYLYVSFGVAASYYLNRVSSKSAAGASAEESAPGDTATGRTEAILEGAAASTGTQDLPTMNKNSFVAIGISLFAVLAISIWIMYQYFESSKLQRVAYQEIISGSLSEPADRFLHGFPSIPNIAAWGESIHTLTARYLIHEKRFEEALEVLRNDRATPFDSRREYFMAMSFQELGQPDSALYYSRLSHQFKPNYFRNLHLMINLLEQKDQSEEALDKIMTFLEVESNRDNNNAWIIATNALNRKGEIEKAYEKIELALRYLPRDSLIQRQHNFLRFRNFIEPHRHLYNAALPHYQRGDYARALPYLIEYLDNIPFEEQGWRMRAIAYYHTRDDQNCIDSINHIFEETGEEDASLLNLRGAALQRQGKMEEACRDFEASMNMGNESGNTNYHRFCASTAEN